MQSRAMSGWRMACLLVKGGVTQEVGGAIVLGCGEKTLMSLCAF